METSPHRLGISLFVLCLQGYCHPQGKNFIIIVALLHCERSPLNQQQLEALIRGSSQLPLSFHIYETIPSTNKTLWELIDRGAAPGTVAIATKQTAGKGQRGKKWLSSIGGLYLSMAFAPNLPAEKSASLTICSAWGIATALRNYNIPVLIKWPNDLLLQGRKLGGILTETRVYEGRITQAIAGVGINWVNQVPETGINLKLFPQITSLEMLAAIVIKGILAGYERATPEAIETILPSYLELLTSKGRPVVVDGRSGVVVGVTSAGDLRVRLHSDAPNSEICLNPSTISLGYDFKD